MRHFALKSGLVWGGEGGAVVVMGVEMIATLYVRCKAVAAEEER